MKKPVVELSDCICCEICVEVSPEVFSLNDAGYIQISELSHYSEDCIDDAARNCPKDCIAWQES